jgi:transposase, IS6 family
MNILTERALRLKRFSSLRCAAAGDVRPRVINVDGHPAYPGVVEQLNRSGELGRNCRCRLSSYLNKLIEQDHRFV